MAEMLTHVVAAYCLATLFSMRYNWIDPRYVTIAMIGAAIPDLSRMELIVSEHAIQTTLDIPFSWFAFHTAGGSFVVVLLGALLVPEEYRRHVFAMLALGAASHLLLDALLTSPSGHSYAILWPLSTYTHPTPNLYLSTDRWPALVAVTAASITWYLRYGQETGADDSLR